MNNTTHPLRPWLGLLAAAALLCAAPARAAETELPWTGNFQKALEQARKAGKRVFIDFTGESCINCKANEKAVFPLPAVRERLEKLARVQLYTDIVPEKFYTPEELKKFGEDTTQREADGEKHLELMAQKFNGTELPLYVVVAPTKDGYAEVARYARGRIIDEKKGTSDVAGFLEFLDKGLTGPVPTPKSAEAPRRKLPTDGLIELSASLSATKARPGDVVTLTIAGTPKAGYWTYPITERTEKQEPSQLSRLRYGPGDAFKPLWPIKESEPAFARDALGNVIKKHADRFTWAQDFLVSPTAKPGKAELSVKARFVICDEQRCTPPTDHPFVLSVDISGEPAQSLAPGVNGRTEEPPPVRVVDVPPDVEGRLGGASKAGGDEGLLAFVLQGVFWGAISLVTPCVFPMIPITVSYFLKQAEREHHRPLLTALVYSGTIVVVLTIAAVALLSVFRAMSTHPVMNFALGGLFVFFALSLFGMYDIELPSGLARFTSSHEGQGLVGTVFMALTFTIISFACVAPFLGGFGGTAATANLGFTKILLGGFAFAVTFASPFTVLALFPALLKRMPKSGTWLNSVKVVMGFLELAAALKFFRTGELLWASEPSLFTYDLVLALYVALSLLCGLYLLCLYRLPHDTPLENLGVVRMLFAALFLGLAVYLTPAMWKINDKGLTQRPGGVVFAWLDSFLLPDPVEDLPWKGDLHKALAEARKTGKRVFVDFTGETCTNCKFNERNVFPRREVRELLEQYVLVALYTDKVPDKFYSSKERREFGGGIARQTDDAKANLQLQRDRFGTEQLPLYVVVEPQGENDFREVARYEEGKINDVSEFVEFLSDNLPAGARK